MAFGYLFWHYGDGLRMAFGKAAGAVLGFLNYFSVFLLARTVFSPWHRILEPYGRGFDPSRFFWILAGNIISRVLGAIVRSAAIAIGVAASAAAAALGVFYLSFWLAAPLLLPLIFVWGVLLFF